MASNVGTAIVISIFGILMVAFPQLFIFLNDLKAAFNGYTPVAGHLMRSPWLYRVVGVGLLAMAWFVYMTP